MKMWNVYGPVRYSALSTHVSARRRALTMNIRLRRTTNDLIILKVPQLFRLNRRLFTPHVDAHYHQNDEDYHCLHRYQCQ